MLCKFALSRSGSRAAGRSLARWKKHAYPPPMHADTIKEVLHAQPFQPFTIHTVSGESYLVDHPDFVALTRGGRTVIVSLPGGEGERVRMLDAALIERIERNEVQQAN